MQNNPQNNEGSNLNTGEESENLITTQQGVEHEQNQQQKNFFKKLEILDGSGITLDLTAISIFVKMSDFLARFRFWSTSFFEFRRPRKP